ncbi:hypothetical protein D4R51_01795 [bacterium]|nr:MAG: hypothetical protein D4R51_01795 [bacterium]
MTVLIKNGLVYDGAGGAPFKSDIVIRDKRIARLGVFSKKDADTILDATGMIITPGLIDVNFDAERSSGIFSNPHQEFLVRQGVTTAIGGSGGISLAPVLSGSFELIKDWRIAPGFNFHARSLRDMLLELERRGIGINFGTLIGYSTIRNFFTRWSARDLSVREMDAAKIVLGQSLREGAFGFSTGLILPHAQRVPAREILELVREAGKLKRVYATHLRYDDGRILEALSEALDVSKNAGVSVEINHLEPLAEFAEFYKSALALIEKETAESNVNFDVFPHPAVIVPIYSVLPDWIKTNSMKEMLENFKNKNNKERILKHLQKIKASDMMIAEVPAPLKFLEGKPLEGFAKNHGMTKTRALFHLMSLTELKAKLLCGWVDKKVLNEFLMSQRSLIAFDYHNIHGRDTRMGDFFDKAGHGGKLPLEKAIAKTTSLVAAKYGIHRRGLVREDYLADLVVWENWKPKTVIINGVLALKDGVFENKLAGSVLKAN